MTMLELPGDVHLAFDHLAAYGLAAIIAQSGAASPRISWSDDLDTRVRLDHAVPWEESARLVREHAQRAMRPESWVQQDRLNGDRLTGLFSPRVKGMPEEAITNWYAERNRVLDSKDAGGDVLLDALDLAFIGALGEPAYWAAERDDPRPDHGASRWEMKTRNRGEEFVGNRLRLLAESVGLREVAEIEAGLKGTRISSDDAKPNANRTPTGLMPPGPVDKARAWCALWGLSLLAVAHRRQPAAHAAPSATAGHSGSHLDGTFHLPFMTSWMPLSRLRSVLCSAQLRSIAVSASDPDAVTPDRASWAWLRFHGVGAVVVFPVHRSDNASAPERWAQRGRIVLEER